MFLKRPELPQFFDVMLLDGGECTIYYDFQYIKDRCSLLLLDDTNSEKCKFIVSEIRKETDTWTILKKSRT